jgi:hypothetical protein
MVEVVFVSVVAVNVVDDVVELVVVSVVNNFPSPATIKPISSGSWTCLNFALPNFRWQVPFMYQTKL